VETFSRFCKRVKSRVSKQKPHYETLGKKNMFTCPIAVLAALTFNTSRGAGDIRGKIYGLRVKSTSREQLKKLFLIFLDACM
jgi:hypothetical protein